jgi:TetR/AcrR family transcriptional regulator, mexCD-oprJ operon repressor
VNPTNTRSTAPADRVARGAGRRARSRPEPRADARANIEKILDATVTCLGRNVNASVSEIAREAGVGRVTLYGHFASRDALVEAAFTRVIDQGDQVLGALDLTGDPRQALRTLITSSWLLMARGSAVLEAAQAVLPRGRVRELHDKPVARVQDLVRRGQAEGVFRTDLPVEWLVNALHHLMKGAAVDVATGRLDEQKAAQYIVDTVLAAYASDHEPRPK